MIRWITESLGTSPWSERPEDKDISIIDIRDMVDKEGNKPEVIKAKIKTAIDYLRAGKKVVICCDYGISRSNAIAAGVLAQFANLSLRDAINQVTAATGETSIKIEVLSAVHHTLEQRASKNDSPHKRNLLITGASGFIGSALQKKLSDDISVTALTSKDLDLAKDVVALDLLMKEQQIDSVLHLANPKVYTNNDAMGSTLLMLKNVLDVCISNEAWLIYPSSWEIYSGYRSRELRANEFLSPNPRGTYGQTKFLCEILIEQTAKQHNLAYTIVRTSPVYGPGGDRPMFLRNFLEKATNNEEIATHRYINGHPIIDLVFVEDIARAFRDILKSGLRGAFNFGTGIGISTTEIARLIVEAIGSKSEIRQVEINSYFSNVVMDFSRAETELGWRPETKLADGLKFMLL